MYEVFLAGFSGISCNLCVSRNTCYDRFYVSDNLDMDYETAEKLIDGLMYLLAESSKLMVSISHLWSASSSTACCLYLPGNFDP